MTAIIDGPILTVAGSAPERAILRVPARGAWSIDIDFVDAPDISGAVEVVCGATTLQGTVVARADGVFALQRRTRIVGGAGGWGAQLAARSYHADNGVSRALVLGDLSADAGEILDLTTVPSGAPLNFDYVRNVGIASRTLEEVAGSAWYVGFDGITKIGERPSVDASSSIFEVLDYDGRRRVVTLGVDAIDSIVVGSILNDPRLPEPQTVRAMEIEIGQRIVARAWCAPSGAERLELALEQLISRLTDANMWGVWKYRVTGTQGDRLELQPSNSSDGTPAIQPISMWPGVSGAFADVTVGVEVLVAFVGGRRDSPVVIAFGPKGGGSFAPVDLTLDATGAMSSLKLGANATEILAWCSKLHDELVAIATSFATAQAPPGGGPLTWLPPTSQYGLPGHPVPMASALGTSKAVAE